MLVADWTYDLFRLFALKKFKWHVGWILNHIWHFDNWIVNVKDSLVLKQRNLECIKVYDNNFPFIYLIKGVW